MPTNLPSPQDEQAGAAVEQAAREIVQKLSWRISAGEPSDILPILTHLQQAARDEGLEMAAFKDVGNGPQCQECWQYKAEPHAKGCWVAAAIRALSRAGKERG